MIAEGHVITGVKTRAEHVPHILATAGDLPVSEDSDCLCQQTGKNVQEAGFRTEQTYCCCYCSC